MIRLAATATLCGCVTTGSVWRFLRLSGATVTLDLTEYTIADADKVLGVLTHMVGATPGVAGGPGQ